MKMKYRFLVENNVTGYHRVIKSNTLPRQNDIITINGIKFVVRHVCYYADSGGVIPCDNITLICGDLTEAEYNSYWNGYPDKPEHTE